jgi:hypothetical protein
MRKKERASKSAWALLFTALPAFLAGVAVAAVQLALRPVSDRPATPGSSRYEVSCIKGGDAADNSCEGRAKAVWHAKPGHYVFSEGDINRLIGNHLSPVVAIDGLETVRVEELPNVHFLDDGRVQVAIVLSLPAHAGGHRFVYQVRGKVVPGGFAPEMGWLGQCPIPILNMAMLQMVRRQMILDKDVTGLAELRRKVRFSRTGDSLVVDVLPNE